LDPTYEGVDPVVPGLSGIKLRPHQCVVVRALIDLETARVAKLDCGKTVNTVASSAIVLSEPFGTGKTYEIIAMVLLKPIPQAIPDYKFVTAPTYEPRIGTSFVLERRITGKSTIRPNLIVVGSSVLIQWERAIAEHAPQLRVFTIANYYSLKQFQSMYNSGAVNHFDVVLLKNGKVTGRLALGNDANTREYHSLVTTIGKITYGKWWSRVFYDDFDVIELSGNAIDALSTVYVSATRKKNRDPRQSTRIADFRGRLRDTFRRPLVEVTTDTVLFRCFNVRNDSEFVEASTRVTVMNQFKYVYDNPDDNFIRLIGALGEDNANAIMEMLNGDAPGTAAEMLGIKSNSIADIFQKVLDNKYDDYIVSSRAVDACARARDVAARIPPHPKGKNHPIAKLAKLRTVLNRGEDIGEQHMKYSSESLFSFLAETLREFTERKQQSGLAIQRVIDNAKEGMCQICCMDLGGIDTFIVKCCGIILCDMCGGKGNNFRSTYDRKEERKTAMGSCANCKAPVDPRRDLVFLDRNFSLESLLKARGDERPPAPAEPDEALPTPAEPEGPEIANPKLRALLAIIRGQQPESRQPLSLHIDRLLEGTVDIPPDPDNAKVVVFASYNETLHKIEGMLREQGVAYERLMGTHREMADTVDRFRAGAMRVLLINSQQHCAGLNLEFCNHMVLFHYITNQNVIGQVVARCQRMMRTENLQLHLLCYKNEENYIAKYGAKAC
jgi:SNF2 family DNA or RNA helicase